MQGVEHKVFMFTGRLSIPRHEAQDLVEQVGGIAGHGLSRNTDYLVVGEAPGSKLSKAQFLGTTLLTEDEFFSLVTPPTEVPVETEPLPPLEEVKLTPEQLEGTEPITDEQWERIHEINPNLKIMTTHQLGRLLSSTSKVTQPVDEEGDLPPESEMSYSNLEKLILLRTLHPETTVYPGRICPICNRIIPYTIHKAYYYCFDCHFYLTPFTDRDGLKMIRIGLVVDVSDFYYLTRPRILLGFPIEPFKEIENGKYLTNNHGGLLFCTFDELDEDYKTDRLLNFVNSLEFVVEVNEFYARLMPKPFVPEEHFDSDELDTEWARFKRLSQSGKL